MAYACHLLVSNEENRDQSCDDSAKINARASMCVGTVSLDALNVAKGQHQRQQQATLLQIVGKRRCHQRPEKSLIDTIAWKKTFRNMMRW
jgi:hypothetical protein